MEITVNNQPRTLSTNALNDLINDMMGEKTNGIAVAVNQRVIPKTDWSITVLNHNDQVMIIKATQGG